MLDYTRRKGGPAKASKAELPDVQAKGRNGLKGMSYKEGSAALSPPLLLPAPQSSKSAAGGSKSIIDLLGEDTLQMAASPHLSIQETGRFEGPGALPALHQEQLLSGLNAEGWGVSSIAEAFEMIDEGEVVVQTITVNETGQVFTHLELYMGDTEVGYIYDAGTMNRVAIVSDQEIMPSAS
jgi:hypothetical protein